DPAGVLRKEGRWNSRVQASTQGPAGGIETGSSDGARTRGPLRSAPAPRTSLLRLRVAASSGFYVRSLAHDIGQRLGCGAHLEALRRTRVGRFRVEEACTLDVLESAGPAAPCVRTMNGLLEAWPEVRLTEEGLRR